MLRNREPDEDEAAFSADGTSCALAGHGNASSDRLVHKCPAARRRSAASRERCPRKPPSAICAPRACGPCPLRGRAPSGRSVAFACYLLAWLFALTRQTKPIADLRLESVRERERESVTSLLAAK